jgi:hypothetical protein
MAEIEIKSVKYTHDAMIDEIVQNPAIKQGEIAKLFGYSETWVSIIVNSDAFKERLAERKAELVDPKIRASLEDRLGGVASRALDKLIERLDNSAGMLKTPELVAIAKLGVGDRNLTKTAPVNQTNLYVVSLPPPAANAKAWSEAVQGGPKSSPELVQRVS